MNKRTETTGFDVRDGAGAVDLEPYAGTILAEADRPLFHEAVLATRANALRASYVMIWLACAESLKRRFREVGQRDAVGKRVAGDISSKERQHKSVDKFVLDKAKEYGFLSDSEHGELNYVYDRRCVYAHPYEEAPTAAQVSHAADAVTRNVLSRPVRLRHNYGERLRESLTADQNFLDDHLPAVEEFAHDTLLRLDERVHGWFLEKYWSVLESVADDPTVALFARRGEWFSIAFLTKRGCSALFSDDEWHSLIGQFPKTLARVCAHPAVFRSIGERAQDSLVGVLLYEATTRPSILTRLEALAADEVLTPRQDGRFREHVMSLDVERVGATRLQLATCFGRIIRALKERDWYVQNPAVALVRSWGPEQVTQLSKAEQVELGRNILQAAEGNANGASRFLFDMSRSPTLWPLGVVRGVLLESFVNESKEIRFKEKHLDRVLDAVGGLPSAVRQQVTDDIVGAVEQGTPAFWVDQDAVQRVAKVVDEHGAGPSLAKCLEAKAKTLPERSEEDVDDLFQT